MGQIVGYVTADEAHAFAEYAESLGVDVTALANLLLRRELQLNRVGQLPTPPAEDERTVKITAHFKSAAIKTTFVAHARRHDLRAGPAATRLFRLELQERWLENALGVNHYDSN